MGKGVVGRKEGKGGEGREEQERRGEEGSLPFFEGRWVEMVETETSLFQSADFPENSTVSDPHGQRSGNVTVHKSNINGCLLPLTDCP